MPETNTYTRQRLRRFSSAYVVWQPAILPCPELFFVTTLFTTLCLLVINMVLQLYLHTPAKCCFEGIFERLLRHGGAPSSEHPSFICHDRVTNPLDSYSLTNRLIDIVSFFWRRHIEKSKLQFFALRRPLLQDLGARNIRLTTIINSINDIKTWDVGAALLHDKGAKAQSCFRLSSISGLKGKQPRARTWSKTNATRRCF